MSNWTKIGTRRLAVQVAIAWNYGFGRLFSLKYNTGIFKTLVHYDGRKTDYYVDTKQLKKYNKALDKSLDNETFVQNLIPEAKIFVEETAEYIKWLIKDAKSLSNEELALLYKKLSHNHANYYTRMWMIFRICERIIMKIERILKNEGLVRIFSIPLEPNDVTNERMDLLKIAIKKDKQELKQHTEKYKHIPMFDFDHEPYTYQQFLEEYHQIKNPNQELKKIEQSFKERKKEFNIQLNKITSKKLKNLIIMLKNAVFLRDYRDMIRQKLNLAIKPFYETIANRLGLTVEEVALLTNQEIEYHLLHSINFSKEEIEKRKKSFLLMQKHDKINILSGNKAIIRPKKEVQKRTIKGITASPGKAKGIARVIYTNKDFNKLKPGEIMVAGMTRQDFVQIMRKASAVITNEGGVTCHAAIISRELSIPCIVGTNNATEIINDGDLIEIEEGHVKIL